VVIIPDNGKECLWIYDKEALEETAIDRMREQFSVLLNNIGVGHDQSIAELSILPEQERQMLLTDWHGAGTEYPQDTPLHCLFEAQVERTPEAEALVFENVRLTYSQLNRCANRLARRLRASGVGPETLVGLYVDRSLEMVVGILGILKSGGAYVPLDPVYPHERLAFMLEDMHTSVLVTQQSLVNHLPLHSAKVLCIEAAVKGATPNDTTADDNLVTDVKSENIAYVIYTSGSTGKPKGVLVTHGNVTRLFDATESWFHFGQEDVWTLFHSHAFDFSVWEIWGALLYGGRLVIVPYGVSRSPKEFYNLLVRECVTVLNQTPSAFQQLIQAEQTLESHNDLALRLIIFGGEALDLKSIKPWVKRHGDSKPQLVNMYGITETTVHVTYRPLRAGDIQNGLGSVIGIPIPDLQIYVLDRYLNPVPIGVAGELYVGGAGVARGYLNRPELTHERFITHPFKNGPDARLYKTGDVARHLPNRDLEYLGRADQQVQIRGFRVELGEIETVLNEHEAVSQAVVVVRGDGSRDQRLVAYFVPASGRAVVVSKLRKHLLKKLPEYMIPQHFVELEVLPLTPNGKVNRRALPEPKKERQTDEAYVAPRNEAEKTISGIWQGLLHVEDIGVHDNFFELGGHSLLLVRMLNKLQEFFANELSIVELFRHPTIGTLARFLTQGEKAPPSFATTQELASKQIESLRRRKRLATARRRSHG
jgi:amino acid adenylation domain-containing protein